MTSCIRVYNFGFTQKSYVTKQVDGFIEGERDYSNLKGDTGPLVYPAGFLYIYSAIQYVTGGQVYPAQVNSYLHLVVICYIGLFS